MINAYHVSIIFCVYPASYIILSLSYLDHQTDSNSRKLQCTPTNTDVNLVLTIFKEFESQNLNFHRSCKCKRKYCYLVIELYIHIY